MHLTRCADCRCKGSLCQGCWRAPFSPLADRWYFWEALPGNTNQEQATLAFNTTNGQVLLPCQMYL